MMNYSPHQHFACFFNDKHLAPYFYALSKKMQAGNICLDLNVLPENEDFWNEYDSPHELSKQLPVNPNLIGETLDSKKPFILSNDKLYIGRNYYYETKVVNTLKELLESEKPFFEERKAKLIANASFVQQLRSVDQNLANYETDEKPDWQLSAAILGFMGNISIITGGPGTGKTTTVAKILALLQKTEPNLTIALTAPTGKAAVRMKESLQNTINDARNQHLRIEELVNRLEPKTIHRLLGAKYQSPFFKHTKNNPIDYDVVIVDEASMIGVGLFAKLLDALKKNSRLIILGDSNQLASVDSGSLFGDICSGLIENENQFTPPHLEFLNRFLEDQRQLDSTYALAHKTSFLNEHLVRLKKTYRYEQSSKMGQFTKAVIQGNADVLNDILAIKESSLHLDEEYSEALFHQFIKYYHAYIEEPDINKALKNLTSR